MSVAQLDSRFGIVEDVQGTDNGLIRNNRNKIVGVVARVTADQRTYLRKRDWGIDGQNPDIKSLFAPKWCRPIPRGGWKPTPVVCYTFTKLNEVFGVVAEATNGGRLYSDGVFAGAMLHLDSSERSKLTAEGWDIQDNAPEDDNASAWAPDRCRPLQE